MKKTILLLLLSLLTLAPDLIAEEAKDKKQLALVEAAFIPVLRERKPQAEMIMQARRGQTFPVRRIGEYWVEVYVPPNNEVGWIQLGMETPNVKIIDDDSSTFDWGTAALIFGIIAVVIVIVILLWRLGDTRRRKALENIGGR